MIVFFGFSSMSFAKRLCFLGLLIVSCILLSDCIFGVDIIPCIFAK